MIEIKNLTHSFGDKTLYKNVNLNINKGEKIGLVGLNGTGKTTFINILTEKIIPEHGEIVFPKNLKVGYLDQFIDIQKNQTILEYLKTAFQDLYKLDLEYNSILKQLENNGENEQQKLNKMQNIFEKLLESGFYEIDTKINQIATGLGICDYKMETYLKNLSGGQKMKVMLAKILLQKPDILILDEPTNYLDTNHIEWFSKFLNKFEGNVLIVSHDVTFLDGVINTVWSLENQTILKYNGNYSSFEKQKSLIEKTQQKRNENLEKERKKLEEYIAKNKVRSSTAKQAKRREKRLQKLEVVKKTEALPDPHFDFLYKHNPFNNLIVLRNLSIGYQTPILSGINFDFFNGEKIRIKGFNGIGKTTLLKTIIKLIPQLFGTINYYGNIDFGFFEQEIDFEDKSQTPLQNVLLNFPDLSEKAARGLLSKVGIDKKHVLEPIKNLSGGEMCRLKIAKLIKEPHTVLVLDEISSHLDVKAKSVLAKAINNFSGLVLFVSHEEDFVLQIKDVKEIDIKQFKSKN